MNAIVLTMWCVLGALQPNDWTPVVATEGAVVTLERTSPAPKPPQPKPGPDGAGAAGQPVTGPLDTLRDAKELIRKGNELADRSKQMLDAAEREGKVTIDIRLPKPATPQDAAAQPGACPGGVCPYVPPAATPPPLSPPCPGGVCPVTPSKTPSATTTLPTQQDCQPGVCRPRLFWRFRR